jgi:hypothetical protein
MRNGRLFMTFVAVALLTSGCFGEEEKVEAPKNDHIMVENKTGVDLKIRLTTRMKTDFPLPYGGSTKIEFPITTAKTLQVKAKSMDPNWDDCLISMRVGQTLIVHQAGEFIECKAE